MTTHFAVLFFHVFMFALNAYFNFLPINVLSNNTLKTLRESVCLWRSDHFLCFGSREIGRVPMSSTVPISFLNVEL